MADSAALASKLADMRRRFAGQAREHAATLAGLRHRLGAGPDAAAALGEIRFICHRLHGGAATFGQPEIGEAAAQAEELTGSGYESLAAGGGAGLTRLDGALGHLMDLIARIENGPSAA